MGVKADMLSGKFPRATLFTVSILGIFLISAISDPMLAIATGVAFFALAFHDRKTAMLLTIFLTPVSIETKTSFGQTFFILPEIMLFAIVLAWVLKSPKLA